MFKDELGFEYPKIDKRKCINCGKCLKVCSEILKPLNNNTNKPKVYACWNKEENVRLLSTSGGIFYAFAKTIIQKGGYVCGAIYNKELLVEHIITNRLEDIEKLRQSKYVQSNLNDVFVRIKALLEKGEEVLFVGTPCQCAGLKKYLNKEYDKLWVIDFICLGVNAPLAYKQYLKYLENKYNSKIVSIQFKNKDFGWNTFHTKVVFENGQVYYGQRYQDLFYKGFIGAKSLYFRESCYNCSFKDFPRIADVSLGDFWGVNKKYDADKGTSVVMLNSKKGEDIFNLIKKDLIFYKENFGNVKNGNHAIYISKNTPVEYAKIKKDLHSMGFEEFIKTYIK